MQKMIPSAEELEQSRALRRQVLDTLHGTDAAIAINTLIHTLAHAIATHAEEPHQAARQAAALLVTSTSLLCSAAKSGRPN
jgi:hypothetical protein